MLPTIESAIYLSLILSQASLSGNTLANLRSDAVQSRMAAVIETERQVAANPDLLRDVGVQEALVALLERENAEVAANYNAFLTTRKSALDEVYAEHYARALGLADRIRTDARPQDQQLLARLTRALVTGSYNPDSAFADGLASEGEAIVPIVLDMTKSPMSEAKWNAYSLMGKMFSLHDSRNLRAPLSTESQLSMRQAARAGLLDPAADVRIWAISAVVGAQDRESIPLLRLLAATDPDGAQGTSKYSVRSVAAAAVKQIR